LKFLIDTHVLLWLDGDSSLLSNTARSVISDSENDICLSVASVWELQIKTAGGKLKTRIPLAQLIESQEYSNNVLIIPISLQHVYALDTLQAAHKDPFDGLLIAQCLNEGMPILSADPKFADYPITVIW